MKRKKLIILFIFTLGLLQHAIAQAPSITLDSNDMNMGVVMEGDTLVFEIGFINSGNADLIITQAWPSCRCSVPEFPKDVVKPGERGSFKIAFHSKGFSGSVQKYITVLSNAPEVIIKFTVTVNPPN